MCPLVNSRISCATLILTFSGFEEDTSHPEMTEVSLHFFFCLDKLKKTGRCDCLSLTGLLGSVVTGEGVVWVVLVVGSWFGLLRPFRWFYSS